MKYTPTGADAGIENTRARLESYQTHQQRHGFSKWIVFEKASGQAVGDAGLIILEDLGWIDLGFRFARQFWGRGFATEVATAWMLAAFEDLGLHELGAFAHPENGASLRVLDKLGFLRLGPEVVLGMQAVRFTRSAD